MSSFTAEVQSNEARYAVMQRQMETTHLVRMHCLDMRQEQAMQSLTEYMWYIFEDVAGGGTYDQQHINQWFELVVQGEDVIRRDFKFQRDVLLLAWRNQQRRFAALKEREYRDLLRKYGASGLSPDLEGQDGAV